MTAKTSLVEDKTKRQKVVQVMLGGYAALAESAWMGVAQASEVLDALRLMPRPGPVWKAIRPRLPKLRLHSLLRRQLTVAEASFVLMASFFGSALLGAVRQILFNAQFGVGSEANAYYAAFRLPDTLFSLVAGGALSSAMIPVLLNTERTDGATAAARLIRLVLSVLLAFFVVVVLLIELFAPVLIRRVLAPGFDAETSRLAIALTRIMLVQPLILAIGSVATAVLNSRSQFVLSGLSIVSHNLAQIAGILATRLLPGLGIYGPALGVVLGALLQILILWPGLAAGAFGLTLAWGDQRLREIVRLLIPNGLSVGVNYAGNIADTAFASTAAETAALGAIYNAWLLVGLPIALLGQAIGQAAFPRLAAHAEAAEWRQLRRTTLFSLGAVMFLAVGAFAGILLLGRTTITVLFERGEFNATAGDLTYRLLLAYAVALPAYVATEVITRGLIALRDTRTPLFTNLAQLIGRIAIMAVFIGRSGVIVVPLALAVTATLETFVLGVVLLFKLGRAAGGR